MKKSLKILTTFALCFSIMANCFPVQAAVSQCKHPVRYLMESKQVYGRIDDWHDVTLISNNMKATCYIYLNSYNEKWCCHTCGEIYYETNTYAEHSLEGLYYKQ